MNVKIDAYCCYSRCPAKIVSEKKPGATHYHENLRPTDKDCRLSEGRLTVQSHIFKYLLRLIKFFK